MQFDSTLSAAVTVVAQDRFETAAAISKRFSTCELIYAELGGTQLAIQAFEDGARGIVEGRPGDSLSEAGFADLDPRFDRLTDRAAILKACNAGDRAETEKLVGALRDTALQRSQRSMLASACAKTSRAGSAASTTARARSPKA